MNGMDFKLIDRILALGNLIGHARLAYIEANNDLNVSSWNKGATGLFGHTEDEAMGRRLNELIPLSETDLSNCSQTIRFSCSHKTYANNQIECELFYAPIMNTKGERLGVAVLAREVTDPPQSDFTVPHPKDVFDFAPIGFFHVNNQGEIILSNPEYAWMTGYESAEGVVEQVSDFPAQAFFDKEKADEFMFAIHEAGEVIRFRCRLRRKDNSFVWALCYAKTTPDESGRADGFNGFAIDISETVRVEQELKRVNEKLKLLSVIDGLTQIPNRRKFDEYLSSEWKRHFRDKDKISLILSDIDYFKLYNDNYGHQEGDSCLIKVARSIDDSTNRSSDLAARYGGEEFAVILPYTDEDGAMAVAEEIRTNVKNLEIPHEKSKVNEHVTLSLGVATAIPGKHNSVEGLLALADEALYDAKEKGRNQSCQRIDK